MAKIYSLPEKPINSIITYRVAYGYKDTQGKIVSKENMISGYSSSETIFLKKPSEMKTVVKNAIKPLSSKEVLFFDDTSKFPRFKLQGSPFKRCIKLEKATKVVISDIILTKLDNDSYREKSDRNKIVIIDNGAEYLIWDNDSYYIDRIINNYGKKGETFFDFLKNNNIINSSAKIIYDDFYTKAESKVAKCFENILDGLYTDIVLDSGLDKHISGTLDSFDEESLNSITEMLSSEDKAIVDMGLKLIPNYNVMEYKLSVNTILSLNYRKCTASKIWQSTSIKQLKETIDFKDPYTETFPGCIENINKKETYTESDLSYARSLIVDATRARLSTLVNGLADSVKNYNLKINATVQ